MDRIVSTINDNRSCEQYLRYFVDSLSSQLARCSQHGLFGVGRGDDNSVSGLANSVVVLGYELQNLEPRAWAGDGNLHRLQVDGLGDVAL